MNNNIKEMFNKLIGAQIVSLSEDAIVVRNKDGEMFNISFYTDHGDCCGYANISKTMFFEENNKNNPIITDLKWDERKYGSDTVILTLYGMNKLLAEYEFECGSGSGWCYGATITAMCTLKNELKETEICGW